MRYDIFVPPRSYLNFSGLVISINLPVSTQLTSHPFLNTSAFSVGPRILAFRAVVEVKVGTDGTKAVADPTKSAAMVNFMIVFILLLVW